MKNIKPLALKEEKIFGFEEKKLFFKGFGKVYKVVVCLSFLLLCNALCATAQSLRISGDVSNILTQEGVAHAVVNLMAADGATLIASDTTRYRMVTEKEGNGQTTFPDKHSGAVFSFIVSKQKEYLLVVKANGFEQYSYLILPEDGKNAIKVPSIFLMPQAKDRQLGEVAVKATRIKMFYKGDTLVYNADAFNVEQTESLRKLVQQLPGAEMKDGEIRINGKRLDNLLISGKDFFQGNIQAALDNLPAYVVSQIKVYDKAGELSELTGRSMNDESYVMDVRLKRKYVGMWMAKLSADGGTEGLFGGQAYLMRFDERQMFTVNADVNNFNQERQMTDMGDMSSTIPWGQVTTKSARLSYYIEPNKIWRLTANGSVSSKDTDKQSWQNNETYLSPNNLMNRSAETLESKDIQATASTSVRARKAGKWQHSLNYSFNFARSRSTRDSRSLSYYLPAKAAWEGLAIDSIISLEEKERNENALLYSLLDPSLTRQHSFIHHPKWQSSLVFGADLLNLNASLKHDTQTRRDFSNHRLTTYADQTTEAYRRYLNQRDYLLDLNAELEWAHQYEKPKHYNGVIKTYLQYSHRYGTANHPEYRLERIIEWSENQSWGLESLGRLPQTEWQALCINEANSYYSKEKEERPEAGVRLSHKIFFERGSSLLIEANESFYYQRRTLDYFRQARQYNPHREGFFFRPSLKLKWKYEKREGRNWMPELDANYQGHPSMPALTQLLPIRDNSDPLNLFVGNTDLNNPFKHELSTAYRLQHVKSGRTFLLNATYLRILNDIAIQSSYNPTTGIRTYMPVNTSHTHSLRGGTEFSTPLDKKKRFHLTTSLTGDYYQAENLSFLAEENTATAGLLSNVGITPSVILRATIGKKLRFYGRWNTAFRHVSQPNMSDNYRQTTLYGDISYTLPFDIQLASIIQTTLYSGNSLSALNRTVTNWDISISKHFLNNHLGVSIKAHDLLQQATAYRSEVTTTGRIESYTDVLPRYLMLTVSYNFNWVRKK